MSEPRPEMTGWRDQPITRGDLAIIVITWAALEAAASAIGRDGALVLAGAVLVSLLLFFWWRGGSATQ